MRGLWHEAVRRLRMHRRAASVIGAARLITAILCLLSGVLIQNRLTALNILHANPFSGSPNLWDLFLPAALLTAMLAVTPLRMQTAWQLGRISGTMDENDLGFLACSSSLWLWSRALLVRLTAGCILILSALPALLLYAAAKSIWLITPDTGESLLYLLTVLHLAMLAAAALLLPLRVYAAQTALPYCYLKTPHETAFRVIRMAFRLTKRQSAQIILMRTLCILPLLIPFSAVYVLPTLLTAEQIRCERAFRHLQPRHSSFFSHLELHAYDNMPTETSKTA